MKIKHYLLIVFTFVLIAFFQPLVMFLGNLMIIVALVAYIYSDLPPAAQDAYELKFLRMLRKARDGMRNPHTEPEPIPEVAKPSMIGRLLGRKAAEPESYPETPIDIEITDVESITVQDLEPDPMVQSESRSGTGSPQTKP